LLQPNLAHTARTSPVARPTGRGPSRFSKVAAAVRVEKPDVQLRLAYFSWFLALFDPQWFLADGIGLRPALKIPVLFFAALLLTTIMKPHKGEWMWGLAAFVAATAVNIPFSYDIRTTSPSRWSRFVK
jgi:hypothetical protein